MSEYEEYQDPGHADPAAEYPAEEPHDNLLGSAIGQPLFEAGGLDAAGYEPGHEPGHEGGGYEPGSEGGYEPGSEGGYEPGSSGDGEFVPYAGGAQEETGYAADSGDTAGGGEATEGTSVSADDYTGDTVSYSSEPTDYTPTAQ
jgi:hypothetical protein